MGPQMPFFSAAFLTILIFLIGKYIIKFLIDEEFRDFLFLSFILYWVKYWYIFLTLFLLGIGVLAMIDLRK